MNKRNIHFKSNELKNIIKREQDFLSQKTPFFIENYSSYKIIPYAYSAKLLEQLETTIKTLKEAIGIFSVPYEQKYQHYDYGIYSTSLLDIDANFLKKLFFYDNIIDKKSIERWFQTSARFFSRFLKDIMVKIAKEFGKDSPIIFLFLLTLLDTLKEKKGEFISINLGKVAPQRKDLYFSNFFFFFVELLFQLYRLETKDDTLEKTFQVDLLSPLIIYDDKKSFLRNPFNYWSLTENLFEILEKNSFLERYDNNSTELSAEEYREVIFACKIKKLRTAMYDFIANNYIEDVFMSKLVSIYYTTQHFFSFLLNDDFRNEIFGLKKLSKLYNYKEKKPLLMMFQENVEEIVKKTNFDKDALEVTDMINSYVALKNHEAYATHIAGILKELKDKRKDSSINLKKEYDEGRLYYFTLDASSILKRVEKQDCAALFIDIREFSKKTFHLKEEAVLELLKEKFYQPLLRYAAIRKDISNLKLAHIAGDSIIFLGAIDEIVRLSLFVKKYINSYKEGLEHIIDDKEKKELLSLDSGIFISFGKMPLITSLSSELGTHTFVIGETINEARKGSKRDMKALSRLDYLIKAEGEKKKKDFYLPFELFIVEGYELYMPPTVEFALLKLEQEKELKDVIEQFFEQAKMEMLLKNEGFERFWTKKQYIYNIGIGLSEEALNAFIKSQEIFSQIKRLTINLEELKDEEIKKFFFRERKINITFVMNKQTGEKFIFRREGSITFSGFYRKIVVWELLTEHMSIYSLLLHFLEQSKFELDDRNQ